MEIRFSLNIRALQFHEWLMSSIREFEERHYPDSPQQSEFRGDSSEDIYGVSWLYRIVISLYECELWANNVLDKASIEVESRPLSYLPPPIEVLVRCNEDAALGYFHELLKFIADEWPEAKPQLQTNIPELFQEALDEWERLGLRKPKNPRTIENQGRLYSLMLELDDEYRYDDDVSLKWEDYIEYIKSKTGKKRSDRYLRDVKKAGDAGNLR